MRIISNMKTKLGHFIIDRLVTQQVIKEWKAGYIEDPLPQISAPPVQAERHTDAIDEKAVDAAIKAQGLRVHTRGGRALDVPADKVAPGKLAPWYWDRFHAGDEPTVQMSAIKLQEELLNRLDEGGQE